MNEQTEREWFERIYQDHADMLFRLGRHLLGGQDDSALYDLMQDAFLDAWSKREKLMAHPNIGGWLALSLKNRAMSARQKAQRRGMRNAYSLDDEESAPVADTAMTPEQEALLGDRVAALRELLGEENAALFLAYAVDGCTAKEIGRRWGAERGLCVDAHLAHEAQAGRASGDLLRDAAHRHRRRLRREAAKHG